MAVTPNPRDQEIQSVLYSANYKIGASGVDGVAGRETNIALKQYAKANGLDDNDLKAVGDFILKRMKDPSFRQSMLDNLATKPQNTDTIRATQWVMERSFQNVPGMRDLETRLMTGKNSAALRTAVAETEGGLPSKRVLNGYGISDDVIQIAKAELNGRPSLPTKTAFRESAADMTAAAPVAQDSGPKNGPKPVAMARLDLGQP